MPWVKVKKLTTVITTTTNCDVREVNLLDINAQETSNMQRRFEIQSNETISYIWVNEDVPLSGTTYNSVNTLEIPNGQSSTTVVSTPVDGSGLDHNSLREENERIRRFINLGRSSLAALQNLNQQMNKQIVEQHLEHLVSGTDEVFIPTP